MATPIPPNRARFTLEEVATATRGVVTPTGEAGHAEGIFSDSRAVVPGSIFVALSGAVHDGHRFVDAAIDAGASIVIVERGRGPKERGPAAVVEVEDTLFAWGDLARLHVERWRAGGGKIVAITGSAGKTTTKELVAALLAAVAPTHFTAGNLNNRIGVPAVAFGLETTHRFAVFEMGMSVPGEIAAIASIARPDVAVVLNVGAAHSEGVGGPEGVMREKGAIYAALEEDGVAVVNEDDRLASRSAEGTRARTRVTFGKSARAAVRLVSREGNGPFASRVTLSVRARRLVVNLPLLGEAAAVDLAAAIAAQESASGVALEAGTVDRALAGVRIPGRAALRRLGGDTLLVDDTYNANPDSVRAALSILGEVGEGRRRVVVLGEMKELGALASAEHEALAEPIARAGVALVIGCGGLVDLALVGAAARGVDVVASPSTEAAAEEAISRVREGDAVLVKGSRSVGAERVVAALVRRLGAVQEKPEVLPTSTKSASSES